MSDVYTLDMFGQMLDDRHRMTAYRTAMAASIRPGDVVIEIGTGPGVTAMLACQLGASHVFAIESNPLVVMGERLAKANGFGDRITFVQGLSTEFDPPVRADVLISDLRGRSPLHGRHIPSIVDARTRLLKPGGVQIPWRDRLLVGLARDDVQFQRIRRPWLENEFGLDLGTVFTHAISRAQVSMQGATIAIGNGSCWAEVDYSVVESPDFTGTVRFDGADYSGERFNALELWFEAELIPGVGFATSPRDPNQVYGRTLLPLRENVVLGNHEYAEVTVRKRLLGDHYIIDWSLARRSVGDDGLVSLLEHSTFSSTPVSLRDVKMRSPHHVPVAGPRSRAAGLVAELFEQGLSIAAIAECVRTQQPNTFSTQRVAEAFVTDIALRFT